MNTMMIDLETLAVPESLPPGMLVDVGDVGVVVMDSDLNIVDSRGWAVLCCGCASSDTSLWWMGLCAERGRLPNWALARLPDGKRPKDVLPAVPMRDPLVTIAELWRKWNCKEVWSKGGFDLDILRGHYAAQRMLCPWQYYRARDLRSVMKFLGVTVEAAKVSHDAMDDAADQVQALRRCRVAARANDCWAFPVYGPLSHRRPSASNLPGACSRC